LVSSVRRPGPSDVTDRQTDYPAYNATAAEQLYSQADPTSGLDSCLDQWTGAERRTAVETRGGGGPLGAR